MNHNNVHIIGIPEREGKDEVIDNLFEKLMIKNFLNLVREKVMQIQVASLFQGEHKEAHAKIHYNQNSKI